MPGIRLEQLDLGSLSRYFANVKTLRDTLKNFDDNYKSILNVIEEKIKKEGILQTLGSLSDDELRALSIYASISKSSKVNEISDFSVTESDGVTYEIQPSKGYINIDGEDLLVYQHPKYHNANEIIETTDKRFSSRRQQEDWDSRVTYAALGVIINSLQEKIEQLERDLFEYRQVDENTQIEEIKLLFNSVYTNSIISKEIFGNNTKKITVPHNLSSQELIVSVYKQLEDGKLELVYPNIYFNNLNSLDLTFNNPVPTTDKYQVIIINKFNLNTVYSEINNICKNFFSLYKFTYTDSNKFTIPNPIIKIYDEDENEITRNALFVNVIDNSNNEVVYPNIEIDDDNIEITFNADQLSIGKEYNIIILNPQSISQYFYLIEQEEDDDTGSDNNGSNDNPSSGSGDNTGSENIGGNDNPSSGSGNNGGDSTSNSQDESDGGNSSSSSTTDPIDNPSSGSGDNTNAGRDDEENNGDSSGSGSGNSTGISGSGEADTPIGGGDNGGDVTPVTPNDAGKKSSAIGMNSVSNKIKRYIAEKFARSYDLIEISRGDSNNPIVIENVNSYGLFNENNIVTREGNKYISLVDIDDEYNSKSIQVAIYGYKNGKSELVYSKNSFFINANEDNDNIFECIFKLESLDLNILDENDFENLYILLFYNN